MRKHLFKWMLLLVAFMVPLATNAQEELTVADGTTTNGYIPVYGYWADAAQHNQILYSEETVGELANTIISGLTFYASSSPSWGITATVSLAAVDEGSLSSGLITDASLEEVWSGTVIFSDNTWSIEFDENFVFEGGNLLVDIVTTQGSYGSCNFYGITSSDGSSRYSYSSTNTASAFLPKITFTYMPNGGDPICGRPTGVAISPFAETAAFSWNPVEGVAGYQWLYYLASENIEPNWDEAEQTEETSVMIEGLEPLTSYVAYVRSLCDFGESNFVTVPFATTAVATEIGEAWSDDFEGDLQWELINGELTNAWVLGTATSNGGEHSLYISNDGGESNAYTVSGATVVYAAKLLSFETGKYEFSYDWNGNGESTYDYLRVVLVPGSVELAASTSLPSGLSTTGVPANWIALDGGSKLNLATEWQSKTVAVNVTGGNYYLVLVWRNDNSSGTQPPAAVDNVSITRLACPYDVTDLAVNEITTASANLTWEGGEAEQWQVVYSTNNSFEDAMEEIVDAPSYDLNELTPATVYYAKVRAYCGGEDFGSWSATIQFASECEPLSEYPYSENFDEYTIPSAYTPSARVLPICWKAINTTTYASYAVYPTIYYYSYTDYSYSSPNSLRFYSTFSTYSNYDPQDQYVILPPMESLGGKQITLKARGYNATSTFWIGTISDPTNAETFTSFLDSAQELTTAYQEFAYTIPAGVEDAYVAIKMEAANSSRTTNGVYIDDIAVSACPTPTGLSVGTNYAESVVLQWNADDVLGWQLMLNDEVVDVDESLVTVDENVAHYTLNNLTPMTNYTVQVRNTCPGDNYSAWSTPVNFTTLNNATAVAFININGMVSADIDSATHTVTVTMLYGTDFDSLSGSFRLSAGATAWNGDTQIPITFTGIDFSEPMTITVKAQDTNYTQDWTIELVNETCATATNLVVLPERVKAAITWNIGDETVEYFNYLLTYEGDTAVEFENNPMVQTINVVGEGNTRTFELTNLSRATAYRLYLKNACSDWSVAQQVTFTTHDLNECAQVGQGTTSTYGPICGYYGYHRHAILYTPEDGLTAGTLTALAFDYTGGANIPAQIYLMNTDATEIPSSWVWNDMVANATLVFDTTANITAGWNTFATNDFNYTGGNLMVLIASNKGGGGGASVNARYTSAGTNNNGYYRKDNSIDDAASQTVTRNNQRPNIQFCFLQEACPAVAAAKVENIGAESATLTWTAAEGDYLETYNVILSETVIEDFDSISAYMATVIGAETSLELTGLNPFTNYFAYVRANCANGEGSSTWYPVTFRTQSPCHTADNLEAELTGRNSVHVTWTNDMENDFEYVLLESDMDEMDSVNPIFMTASNELDLTDLNYETDYTLYVRHNCGDYGVSPWQSVEFTTLAECPELADVEVSPAYSFATFEMTNAEYCPAVAWRIIVQGAESNEEFFNQVVTTNPYTVIGLTPEMDYVASVAAVCGEEVESVYTSLEFTTTAAPSDCETVAEGTATSSYLPFNGTWMDASQHNQLLYPAEMLENLEGQTIESMKFYVSSGTNANKWDAQTITVKLMETDVESLSALQDVTDAATVFTGTLTANATEGMVITFDEAYTYQGGNLLVDLSNETNSQYAGVTFIGVNTSVISGRYSYNSTNQSSAFLPKVDFCVVPSDCHAVRDLTVNDITSEGAEISWLPGTTETEWQVFVSTEDLTADDLTDVDYETVNTVNYGVTGFEADADVYVFVRAICDAEEELYSDWKRVFFTTTASCSAPEAAEAVVAMNREVTFTIIAGEYGQPMSYAYEIWPEGDMENMIYGIVDTNEWTILMPGGAYEWHARTICTDEETSRWTDGNDFYVCSTIEVTAENPFIEDFSNEDRLGCWTNVTEGSGDGWTVNSNSQLGTCFYSTYYGPTALISPAIQLPESGTATLSFNEVIAYLNDYDQNTIYVVPADFEMDELDDLAALEPLWAPTADEFEAQNVVMSRTFDLSEYMGQTFRLIFLYEGDNAHAWYVNNIEVAAEDAIVYYERTIIDTVCDEYQLTNSNGDVLAVYTESGEYENIYEDSVYGMVHAVLNLTINYSTRNIDEQTACDAYTWPLNNMTYTESTDSAFFVFVNEQGCPHITELHLTLYHKEHSYTEVSSCGPYTWELTGATYNKSGMKFNKGTTDEGCQIRDTLVLTVVERWGSYTKVANCGPYTWDKTGQTYNKSGLKFFKDTADDGCPVRDTLELTIVERWGRYTEATSCGPYTWELNNTTYNNGGLKFNKSYADDGCEIRDTLNLIIVEVGGGSNVFVKNCGPYTWDVTGQTYNKSGEKIYTTVDSVDGCFHRDTLTLTIVDRWGSYTELNYCGPYTWEKTGQTYNKSGLKFYKGTAEDGCPVRDTLNLKIEDRFHSYTEVANCGPYTWDLTGQTYNKSGMKFRKGTAENGCLIRDTLVLTVVDRWSSYTKVANCGPYTWDKTGQTYNKSGLKFYKSVAEDGCPIRDTLELTVVTKWSSNDTVVSCDAPYTWDKTGQTYKKTGLKFFKGTAADGCPIRDTLYVIIGQSEHSYNEVTSYGPYTWDLTGKTYNKSGLKFNKGTNADGCPVRDTLNLIVLESNTGAESYEYEIAENESPIEAPETIEAAQLTSLNAVKVYPNPTTGHIQINVTEAEKVEVLDLVGRLVAVYENTNTLDLTNLADGTYTLRITMAEGVALRKVVKR